MTSITAIEEPQVVDITIVKGNSFNRTIEIEDDDGTPTDLSSFDAVGQLWDDESLEVLANFSIPSLGSDGKIPLLLKVSDTSGLKATTAKWSLTLVAKTNPDFSSTTIIVGNAEIKVAYLPPG